MKEHFQEKGVRKWAGGDLIELQSEPLKAIQSFFAEYDSCVITGVEITGNGELFDISAGLICVSGFCLEGRRTAKLAEFGGVKDVLLPIYLSIESRVITREYADGGVKPIAYNYIAVATPIKPAGDHLVVVQNGAKRFLDVAGVTQKLDKDGNGKDVTIAFSQAPGRVNLVSGEKLSVIMGKISKWFASLHAVSFTGKAKDLIQEAAHRLVSDVEKTKWNDTYRKSETLTKKEITDIANSKINKDSVVQSMGNGDSVVMSQKAVSYELEKLRVVKIIDYIQVKVPQVVSINNRRQIQIAIEIFPKTALKNIIFRSHNDCIEVYPDGRMLARRVGVGVIDIIPTQNTQSYKTVAITVEDSCIRSISATSLRLTNNVFKLN